MRIADPKHCSKKTWILFLQALYAETLMSYDEFCTMFSRAEYDKVKITCKTSQQNKTEFLEKYSRKLS